ncbi:sensor histidine kinase [Kitasatospora sp. NPDC056446]|uniref:sensor histidine kinase n=1 Tax=Kitasatospora sp. NPDC056446 TaxID=3345819 RepID=UPI00367D0172
MPVRGLLGYSLGGPGEDGPGEDGPIALTALVLLVLAAVPLLTRRRYPLASLTGVLVLGLALNLSGPVPQERRRIARELHDIVAHHITTMQLMGGGARANLGRDTDVVRDALVTLESSGRTALREMRQLLDVLRAGDEPDEAPAEPQPGAGDLGRLVEESRKAGPPTEFDILGEERRLPPSTGLAVFRIVQESLTNTRKHAGGARAGGRTGGAGVRARVRLTYHPDRITVEVSDNGTATPADTLVGALAGAGGAGGPGAGRTGYGLIGMRERVALLGGSLVAGGVDGGGFRVVAGLPVAPVDGDEPPGRQ